MLEWDDRLTTGVERIDSQHHIFFSLIGEFEDARQKKASMQHLHRALQEIISYASFHFISEQNVMKDCGYPELSEHLKLHTYLLNTLNTKASEMALGICSPKQVSSFLLDWFTTHVRKDDKKFAEHEKAPKH